MKRTARSRHSWNDNNECKNCGIARVYNWNEKFKHSYYEYFDKEGIQVNRPLCYTNQTELEL